jgi:hypothetical protein
VSGIGPGRPGSRPAGVLAGVLAGTVLLAAACGSSSPAAVAGPANYQKAVAYVQCMRTHGVPDYPDPNNNGVFISTKENRGDFGGPRAASANQACQHLLPNGGQLTPAQQQQLTSQGLKHAACMRTHGITKFPDPSRGDGFNLGEMKSLGIDISSPQFKSAQQACYTGAGGL